MTVAAEDIARLALILEPEDLMPDRSRGRWVGNDYQAMHRHLAWLFGPASAMTCVDGCRRRASSWSLDSYLDAIWDERVKCWWSSDPARYAPRCGSCHQSHDRELRRYREADE
jgi:hypothetical protein